jgi:hypothetical protein
VIADAAFSAHCEQSRSTSPITAMLLFRFIFYTILAYAVLRFIRWLLASASPRNSASRKHEARPAQMIRCRHCGMFVTQRSAIVAAGEEFCSQSCAQSVNRV